MKRKVIDIRFYYVDWIIGNNNISLIPEINIITACSVHSGGLRVSVIGLTMTLYLNSSMS